MVTEVANEEGAHADTEDVVAPEGAVGGSGSVTDEVAEDVAAPDGTAGVGEPASAEAAEEATDKAD